MKKFFAIIMMLAVLCSGFAAMAEQPQGSSATVLEGASEFMIQNVPFEGNYYGFCITPEKPGAKAGDVFDVTGTSGNILDVDGADDVSNLVKCAIIEGLTTYFPYTTFFTDGPYKPSASASYNIYSTVWHILGAYEDEPSDVVAGVIAAAEARAAVEQIPDTYTQEYTIDYVGTRTITFDFKVFLTRNAGNQQNFFGFKVAGVNAAGTPLPTITPVPTPTPTPTPVVTSTPTPVVTSTPTPVVTPTPIPVVTSTPTPVVTPTPIPVVTSTPTPVVTPTPTPVVTPTPTVSITSTPAPTTTVTPIPGVTSTPTVTATPDPGVNVPQTGDNANIGLWIALLVVSGAVLMLFKRKSA